MRVADLADDENVLDDVERLAGDILKNDPGLSAEEHKGLKAGVGRLFENIGEYGFN